MPSSLGEMYNVVFVLIVLFSAEGIKLNLDSTDDKVQVEKFGHFDLSLRYV